MKTKAKTIVYVNVNLHFQNRALCIKFFSSTFLVKVARQLFPKKGSFFPKLAETWNILLTRLSFFYSLVNKKQSFLTKRVDEFFQYLLKPCFQKTWIKTYFYLFSFNGASSYTDTKERPSSKTSLVDVPL